MIVYDLNDLMKMYDEGTLPEGEKVFKYKAAHGLEKWIHIDELKVQAGFKNIYPGEKFVERFTGIINRQHDPKSQH